MFLLVLMACSETTTSLASSCEIVLEEPAPAEATPGTLVTVAGGPMTTVTDTAVRVGGVDAVVELVDRVDCDDCDSCREDSGCSACGDCDACGAVCAPCLETVAFLVPDLPAGPAAVTLYNAHGGAYPTTLTVLPADTTSATGTP